MHRVTTGDQAVTPIMRILIGIAGIGRGAIGAIGEPKRDVGPAKSGSPASERRNLYRNLNLKLTAMGRRNSLPIVFCGKSSLSWLQE
jgi:hypothetical protein